MKDSSVRQYSGFTMIELVIVIIVLGILAAYVTVKYNGLAGSARRSVVKTLASSVKSASAMAHANLSIKHNLHLKGKTVIDGETVAVAYGFAEPSKDGIVLLLDQDAFKDFDISSSSKDHSITFQHQGAREGKDGCKVVYTYDSTKSGNVPKITVDYDDCD